MRSRYADAAPYVTKDGSTIRELMHPSLHGNRRQSLAEATVEPETRTQLHRHAVTEELYQVSTGSEPLRILCCCSPPCSHEDIELVEGS